MENTQCYPNYNGVKFASIEEAKAACSLDVNCGAVFQYGCSDPDDLDLCPKDATIADASSKSCIYRKGIVWANNQLLMLKFVVQQ